MQEKCNDINGLVNRLANVRVRAMAASDNLLYWDILVITIKTFTAEKALEIQMVCEMMGTNMGRVRERVLGDSDIILYWDRWYTIPAMSWSTPSRSSLQRRDINGT